MLTIFVRNSRIIQGIGMFFAVAGTAMHMLNISSLMTPTLSHTWSSIAIAGFFMTASSPLGNGLITAKALLTRRLRISHKSTNAVRNDDVSLP